MKKRIAIVLTITALSWLSGCSSLSHLSNLQPVNPWEKGNLAKPHMTFENDPLDQRFTQHVYGSKESSSGGYGVGGGGCGCN
ncbi:MAG: hypothetical protein RLZZ495_575 [Pseudomonadota bacterium]|jgi:hypothetical protein